MTKDSSIPVAYTTIDENSWIINSLMRCGVDWPTIFSLVWGPSMATDKKKSFPVELRNIVQEILDEEKFMADRTKFDFQELAIHDIILDLLKLLYEKQVCDILQIVDNVDK